MSFRITTGMMLNTYKYNLQNTTQKVSDSRDQVMTQRKFNSYAEDPAAATLAFRLRRDYYQTNNYLNNTKDVYSKFNTAWNNLAGVVEDLSDATARVSSIRGNNGTAGESRTALATVLRETSESVIHSLNQKLGDHFIFAGNDALNAPFSWDGETLLYRGINVHAGSVEKPTAAVPSGMADITTAKNAVTASGGTWTDADEAWYNYYTHATDEMPSADTEPTWLQDLIDSDTSLSPTEAQGWADYYQHKVDTPPAAEEPNWDEDCFDSYGTPILEKIEAENGGPLSPEDQAWVDYYKDQSDLKKLEAMAGEEMYIDLGMGAAESSPNHPVSGTYFNSALAGIDFIGYGVDEDGDPKNLALIMRELADVFDTWGENGQKYLPEKYRDMSYDEIQDILDADGPEAAEIKAFHEEYEAKAFRLMDKLKAAQEGTTEKWVELDARSVFLQTNETRLTTQKSDLNAQILDVEQIDLAEAITNFSWDMYCYNSALKIGNQLLSQSLIDYMS